MFKKIRTQGFGKTTSLITFISLSQQSISVYIALQRFDGTLTEFDKYQEKTPQRLSKLAREKKKMHLEISQNISQKNVHFHSSLEMGKL